jgi:hypothetical protein
MAWCLLVSASAAAHVYKRWEREEPMQLRQMDVTGSVFLADGTECKLITGIDDHSRFCVIAMAVRRATARAARTVMKSPA